MGSSLSHRLLLTFPAFTYGGIFVNIRTCNDPSNPTIEWSGSDVAPISDAEIQSFEITDFQLKRAIEKHFDKKPDDVFVRGPTPWGDLYTTYAWKEIKRKLVPKRATVVGYSNEAVVVARHEFINNSKVKTKHTAEITQQVQDTITSTWSKGGELTVGAEISFKFDMGFLGLSAGASYEHKSTWGKDSSKSKMYSIGSSTAIEVELEPGQAVVAKLTATRGTLNVRVDYSATLEGQIATRYYYRYQDHHYWAFIIQAIQDAGRLPKEITSSEELRIGFYTDVKVTVNDLHQT